MSTEDVGGLPSLPHLRVPETTAFPTKEIYAEEDVAVWQSSDAYARLTLMVARLNAAVRGIQTSQDCFESDMTGKILSLLDRLDSWVDEIPLHNDPQRFGNRAFRDWGERLEKEATHLHEGIISPQFATIMPEVMEHFKGSFGSFVRIDYGSGHELAFIGYLTCLYLVGLFDQRDEQAIVTRIFLRYLRLCHRLQKVYNLEPAGSKGVWGLDDHQFLSYLFGSAQLADDARWTPKSILEPSSTTLDADDLYSLSVAHVRNLKRGPFNEHSPMLDNIARTVPNWRKVNSGLLKMWHNEVLGKQPVVQHLRFCSLLSWTHHGRPLPASKYAGLAESSALVESGASAVTQAPWANAGEHHSAATGGMPPPRTKMMVTKAPWA